MAGKTIRMQGFGARAGGLVTATAVAGLLTMTATQTQAQVGIGVTPSTATVGTIGHDKMQAGSTARMCPAGTVAMGLRHRDKGTTTASTNTATFGMTVQFGLFCANIVPTQTGVTVQGLAVNPPASAVTNYNYASPGPAIDQTCGANQIVHRVGGWDRDWDQGGYPAWSSALSMVCDPVSKNANDWVRIGITNPTPIQVGVTEARPNASYPNHVQRGPFCNNTDTSLVTGLYAQAGGEGIDGINVYCGTLTQARFSAQITFTDFAWSQTRGAGGWLVDLNLGSTLLANDAGMTGQARTPYALNANDTTKYAVANEVYVLPNSNYQATVNARPAGVVANSYYLSGNCLTGITLINEQDGVCSMNVEGLPDLTPSVVSPPNVYAAYNTPQNMTIGVKNIGPGAVVLADGFRLDMTLPTGWSAQGLPVGCTLTGQLVSCAVPALAASTAPGTDGGSTSFTFQVIATTSANGTFNAPVTVNTNVPNGDSNPGNDDYNLTNNTTNGTLQLLRDGALVLSKIWVNAAVNDQATLSAASSTTPSGTLNSVANTASETDTGTAVAAPVAAVFNLSETLGGSNVGAYNAGAWSCTGGTLSGSQLTIRPEDSGQTITCSIRNTRRSAEVQVTKTANPTTVRSGQNVTWTITARNNGPDAANGTILTDTPGAGLDCTVPPPPTCVASNGASCPATYTAAALAGGVPIPVFPNTGQVVITLTCRATASGL